MSIRETQSEISQYGWSIRFEQGRGYICTPTFDAARQDLINKNYRTATKNHILRHMQKLEFIVDDLDEAEQECKDRNLLSNKILAKLEKITEEAGLLSGVLLTGLVTGLLISVEYLIELYSEKSYTNSLGRDISKYVLQPKLYKNKWFPIFKPLLSKNNQIAKKLSESFDPAWDIEYNIQTNDRLTFKIKFRANTVLQEALGPEVSEKFRRTEIVERQDEPKQTVYEIYKTISEYMYDSVVEIRKTNSFKKLKKSKKFRRNINVLHRTS